MKTVTSAQLDNHTCKPANLCGEEAAVVLLEVAGVLRLCSHALL
jgi:hypothetical protein